MLPIIAEPSQYINILSVIASGLSNAHIHKSQGHRADQHLNASCDDATVTLSLVLMSRIHPDNMQ